MPVTNTNIQQTGAEDVLVDFGQTTFTTEKSVKYISNLWTQASQITTHFSFKNEPMTLALKSQMVTLQ